MSSTNILTWIAIFISFWVFGVGLGIQIVRWYIVRVKFGELWLIPSTVKEKLDLVFALWFLVLWLSLFLLMISAGFLPKEWRG